MSITHKERDRLKHQREVARIENLRAKRISEARKSAGSHDYRRHYAVCLTAEQCARIRWVRDYMLMDQEQFATLLGIPRRRLSQIENARISLTRISAGVFESALRRHLPYIFEGTNAATYDRELQIQIMILAKRKALL